MLALFVAFPLAGCRTDTDDVARWGSTVQGPRKLVAVLTHDRYSLDLRVEAALSLVSMKPRGGRRIGILGGEDQDGLMDALGRVAPGARTELVRGLAPRLVTGMKMRRLPAAKPGEAGTDPSIPYKDAAFALLTHDSGSLVTEPAVKSKLREGIAQWIAGDFARRIEDSSQVYAMEQLVRELRDEGVRALPSLIEPGAPKIDRLTEFVGDYGDAPTRLEASRRLVLVAEYASSERWLDDKRPSVEAANRASKLKPAPEQLRAQLVQYQDEELSRLLGSMKRLGGAPVVNYLLGFARDPTRGEKRRTLAMAALRGNLDRNDPAHAQAALGLAAAPDAPDKLRDAALACVAEFPRRMVIDRLYEQFGNEQWRVRWAAAELALRLSQTSQLEEFFDKLGEAKGLSITEPIRYGLLISHMKGSPPPAEVVDRYLGPPHPVGVRMSALAYYHAVGTRADLPKLEKYEDDKAKAPSCAEDAKDCEWKCEVGPAGKREAKEITTLGEFVTHCIQPAMEARAPGQSR